MTAIRYLLAIGFATAFTVAEIRADIAYNIGSRGAYVGGGSWASGPYPELGFLYQVLWLHEEPNGTQWNSGGNVVFNSTEEFVLFEGFASNPARYYPDTNYGYIYYSDQMLIETVQDDDDVGGHDINRGYLYFRLFQYETMSHGSKYYQSPTIDTSTMPDVDLTDPPLHPTDILVLGMTGSGPAILDRTIMPEPNSISLLLLACAIILVRRTCRD